MERLGVDKKIFWLALTLVAIISVPILIAPETGTAMMGSALSFITGTFGWLYMWVAILIFGFLVWLAASKYGRVKFGPPDSRPEFSTVSWIAMLFTAGIGGGIMYWGVIEWAYYYTSPPRGIEPESAQAANWAATYPLFHWGFTAWAIYCFPAVILAYAFHVKRRGSLRLSDACRGVIGDRADGWLGKLIDVLFIFGIVGAAGTSLGLEVPILAEGVAALTPIAQNLTLDIGIIVVWTAIFGVSVFLGLQKGLKRLADINVYLALGLGLFILVAGPAVFILNMFTNSIGLLLQNFVQMSFYMDPVRDTGFTETWTVFYWGWWIAYAPFIGLFAARISRGRTMRGLITAMLGAGSFGCWIAFAILGNTGLYFQINNIVPVTQILEEQGGTAAIVAIMQGLPLGSVALVVFLALLIIFLATTLDSSAYTMAAVASSELQPDEDPARWHRVFWAVALATVSIALMAAGGLEPLQTLSIITAFPLIFVLGLAGLSFRKWLIEDQPHLQEVEEIEQRTTTAHQDGEAIDAEPSGVRERT